MTVDFLVWQSSEAEPEHMQICILEGKSYADALPEVITDAFLDANTLLTDAKGKGVLAPGRGCEKGPDMKVIARFHQGKV